MIEAKIGERLSGLPVPVAVTLPSGRRIGAKAPRVRLDFRDSRALMLMTTGRIGALGSAIVEGRVGVEGRMGDAMEVAAALLPRPGFERPPGAVARFLARLRSGLRHSRSRDAHQIGFHYDLADDFYALWLDPRRVYSCAYFAADNLTLDRAQEAKLDLICRKLDLRENERFLDIGAGWGALLLWAAENYGVDATGITLSRNQHAHVTRLIAERGLAGRVRVELRDYRDLAPDRPFDKIASVGMFEHVGHANMPVYFGKLHSLIRPGGLIMNHGITAGGLDDAPVSGELGGFIERHIFPGGELIHVSQLLREAAGAGLEPLDTENLRPHYARTLRHWSNRLESRLPKAEAVLVGAHGAERAGQVLRAFRLYLAGCAMAFERGWVSLYQMLAARPDGDMQGRAMRGAQSAYPFRRDYIYADRAS